jgi:glycine cleavage system H protein
LPEATYPDDLRYHDQHGWVRLEDDESATLGITWFAQDSLGEIVSFEPPELGTTLTKDTPYTQVESVKAISDVIAPISGEVVAVNDTLTDSPEKINEDPYGAGWLVKVKLSRPDEAGALLSAADYQALLHS